MAATNRTGSLASRLSAQFTQQTGRSPVDQRTGQIDPDYAEWSKTALPAMMASDQAERDRSKRRWGIADKVAYGVATIPFAAAGASALGWGASQTTPMSNLVAGGAPAAGQVPAGTLAAGALPTGAASATPGITLSTGGATLPTFGGSSALPTVTGGGGGGGGSTLASLGGWFGRGNNAIEAGKAGAGLFTSWMGNRANQNALRDSNALTMADNEKQRAFLKEQYDREHQDYLDAIAEQKRQWDEEQKEKARQWEAMEPWREAGRGNLTRMNSLLDEPRPGRVAYQPTFQYRP